MVKTPEQLLAAFVLDNVNIAKKALAFAIAEEQATTARLMDSHLLKELKLEREAWERKLTASFEGIRLELANMKGRTDASNAA